MEDSRNQAPVDDLAGLAAGSEEAFARCFANHEQAMFSFLRRYCRDDHLAADLVQEAFLRLWENRALLRPAHSVRNYLFTIVLNLYRDRRRREMRVRQVSLDVLQGAGFEPGAEDDHAADCADQDLARFVRERVDNLPDEERAVVLMKKLGEMSYEGIAEASGDSVRTVKRRVRSALDRLARDLARCGFRIEEACLWMLIG